MVLLAKKLEANGARTLPVPKLKVLEGGKGRPPLAELLQHPPAMNFFGEGPNRATWGTEGTKVELDRTPSRLDRHELGTDNYSKGKKRESVEVSSCGVIKGSSPFA